MQALKLTQPRTLEHQVENAFEILHYNQNLVQFADSKANTLILINSIALASIFGMTVAVPPDWRALATILRVTFLLASIASVGLCLQVVLSRIEDPGQRRRDLVFFADILARPSVMSYRLDFSRTDGDAFLGDLVDRNYRIAAIASRKYRFYGMAQQATVSACALWMLYIVLLQAFV
jgi:hypothetical protein